jgi:hypothetical protein
MHLEYKYFVCCQSDYKFGNLSITVNKRIKNMCHIQAIEKFVEDSHGFKVVVSNYKLLSIKLKFK